MDRKQYLREYYQRTCEKQRARRRVHYQVTRDEYLRRSKEQREREDPEKIKAWKRKWRRSEKGLQQNRKWYAENSEVHLERTKNWKQRNVAKVRRHTRTRQAALMQRTPPWLTPEHHRQIQAIYDEAHRLETLDGIPRHVDHIVPLQGETVSGLHVPWNLQILTEAENCRKCNRWRTLYGVLP